MSSALRDLWIRAGLEEPVLSWDELRRWPAESDKFIRLELLRETEPAESVICDNCFEAHSTKVLWTPNVSSVSGLSPFIACPVEGVLDVDPERLRQWTVDLRGLATLLADSLQLSGAIEALPGGRQWALGRRHLAGRFRDVFLVATDNGPLDPRIVNSPAAVVLVPHRWRGTEPRVPVFALSAVASAAENGLVLDVPYIEDALCAAHSAVRAKPVAGVRIPDGARWEELSLEMGDATVVVSIRDSRFDLSLEDCGLTDGRQGEAAGDRALQTLRLLARHNGVFFSGEAGSGGEAGTPFRGQISHLRKRIQALFPIEGNPITYHAKARCYRCAFQIRLAAAAGFPTPSGATWADFHFHETRAGALLVSIGTREVFRAWEARRGEDGRSSVEVAEGRGQFAREYRLEDLQLADQTGRATAEGRTLMDFLRHAGELARRPDDMAVLRLRRALQTWADLVDDPFEYRSATRLWVARFGCSSDRPQ